MSGVAIIAKRPEEILTPSGALAGRVLSDEDLYDVEMGASFAPVLVLPLSPTIRAGDSLVVRNRQLRAVRIVRRSDTQTVETEAQGG